MYSGRGQDSGYEDEESELHTSCESGTLGDILTCLQSSGSDTVWYHEGLTPLHVAVLSGRQDVCDVITVLLDYGADINAKTLTDGNTALHLAVLHGTFPRDFEVVMLLLESNTDLSLRNKVLRTPYDCAIASGQYELAGTMNGTIPPDRAREYYKVKIGEKYGPYIIEAVLDSNEKKLHENIELGGNPNTLNKHGCGAVHYAVTHSQLPEYDTLSTLLQAGADPNLRDEEGDTALNLVIKSQNLRDSGQMTRCVQLLVDAGAESNICDWDGKDACKLAEEKGYDDVLAILRQKPSKPPLTKRESRKSVVIKEPSEDEPIVKHKPGPTFTPRTTPREDVNAPNAEGLCPIHVATLLENEILRHSKINTLIDKGAEVSKQVESTGNTSLHICAEKDYGSTAKVLLDHHIDYTIKNNDGKTAYDIATDLNHDSVAEAIAEKRGDVQENWKRAGKKAKFCTIL